jgi:glycine/D-amino acid oxidase-like deaminating enzyme
MEHEADVVVVGAGIVGCASAYYLARRGVQVVLLEQGDTVGEQSRKNWGFVRQQGRDPAEVPLMMASNRIWRELENELEADIEWVQGGNLALAATGERMDLFEQWLDVARQFGLDTRLVTAQEIGALVPGIQGEWVGGMYTPSDGHAEPDKATDALSRAAVAHGARLYTRCAVQAILTHDGAVSGVVTERGTVRTTCVVCAAGAWSSRLVQPLGLTLPQRWVRGTVARTTAAPPVTTAGVWAPTVSFRQRQDGTFNIAAGGAADHDATFESLRHLRLFMPNYWKNRHLFRLHVGQPLWRDLLGRLSPAAAQQNALVHDRGLGPQANPVKVEQALAQLKRLVPTLGELSVERSWAGYIDTTPDVMPVIGEAPKVRGLIFATGFSGHGFAMGPIAGVLVSELIRDGQPSLDLHSFRLSRFTEGAFGKPRNVL